MDLSTYAAAAARTRNPALDDRDALLDAAAGLAEEAGEVLASVRKHRFQGRVLDRNALVEELGDALWCLTTAAAALGATLDEVAERNVAKLARRYPAGFEAPAPRDHGLPSTHRSGADPGSPAS